MGRTRGVTGDVAGIPAVAVRRVFVCATDLLLESSGEVFSRAALRASLGEAAKALHVPLADGDLQALEHGYFRAVEPLREAGTPGFYRLPRHVDKLAHHREYRLPGVRLSLPDAMQLAAVLQFAVDNGAQLTPALAGQLERCQAAMNHLGIPRPPRLSITRL